MGGFTTFNIQHGFTESLIRGMRSTFLTSSDYHHLTQCESLDDAKMNLQETDYGDKVSSLTTSSNSSSNSKTLTMSPSAVQQLCVEKLVEEFVWTEPVLTGIQKEWKVRVFFDVLVFLASRQTARVNCEK